MTQLPNRVGALVVLVFAVGCGSSTSVDMASVTTDLASVEDMAVAAAVVDLATHINHPVDMADNADSGVTSYTLTVDNTIHWCDITVTIDGHATEFKTQDSMTFMAPAGTTVMLSAVPNPGLFAVKWTGVTTMSGSSATYVMTNAAAQSVTACCPTSAAGAGC